MLKVWDDIPEFMRCDEVREYYDILSKEEIIEKCADAEIILCNKAVIDEEIMAACPKLKYIGLFATGYNNIDTDSAHKRGITVCNAPGYSTDSVAQLVFAYILNNTTSLDKYNESTHSGEWIRSSAFSYFPYPINELSGKTLYLIGDFNDWSEEDANYKMTENNGVFSLLFRTAMM